jgi:hypothetical protein
MPTERFNSTSAVATRITGRADRLRHDRQASHGTAASVDGPRWPRTT